MKLLSFFLIASSFYVQSSIYDFVVQRSDRTQIKFSDFQGKKILIVNLATNSPYSSQIGELEQLHRKYGDSLVIIGFPSNSFGNEQRHDSSILKLCRINYGVSYLLASKGAVKGNSIQPIYKWLTSQSRNGVVNTEVKEDFQKYLIDNNGSLVGIFSGALSPLSNQLVDAITGKINHN